MPAAPTGRAGCCRAICTGVLNGLAEKVGRVEGDKGGGEEWRDMCKGKGNEKLAAKEVFTLF